MNEKCLVIGRFKAWKDDLFEHDRRRCGVTDPVIPVHVISPRPDVIPARAGAPGAPGAPGPRLVAAIDVLHVRR